MKETEVTWKRRRCRLRKMSTQELVARARRVLHCYFFPAFSEKDLRHFLVSELAKFPVKKG